MLAPSPHELRKNGVSLDRKLDYTHFMRPKAGFSERGHTADWELEVWAPDFPGLLAQAARGMYSISGVRLKEKPRQEREIHLTHWTGKACWLGPGRIAGLGRAGTCRI